MRESRERERERGESEREREREREREAWWGGRRSRVGKIERVRSSVGQKEAVRW